MWKRRIFLKRKMKDDNADVYDRVYVVGYYFKGNYGDDLLLDVAQSIFQKRVGCVSYHSIENIEKEYDYGSHGRCAVVLFGGEVLNSYFLDRLVRIYLRTSHIVKIDTFVDLVSPKFYAFGVSTNAPFNEILLNQLSIFTHILFRNQCDYDTYLRCRPLETARVSWSFDPVFYAGKFPTMSSDVYPTVREYSTFSKGCDTVAFFLSNTCADPEDEANFYKDVVPMLVDSTHSRPIRIYLVAMCVNANTRENDNLLNNAIYEKLPMSVRSSVCVVSDPRHIPHMIRLVDVAVCWRFHAHVISILHRIPFLSVSTTPKVRNLLRDTKLEDLYMPTECVRHPQIFYNRILDTLKNAQDVRSRLRAVRETVTESVKGVYRSLFDNYFTAHTSSPPFIGISMYIPVDKVVNTLYGRIVSVPVRPTAKEILFQITGRVDTVWEWGLQEKISSTDLLASKERFICDMRWIVNEILRSPSMTPAVEYRVRDLLQTTDPLASSKINIDYIDQYDMNGLHRSGWGYVVSSIHRSGMTTLHRDAILCDLYVDRTFHWNREANTMSGISLIPYVKPWIGFIHHTTHVSYTPHNVNALFRNELFLESLRCCGAFIVMTNSMRLRVQRLLESVSASHVKVYMLYHPTEFVGKDARFRMSKFKENPKKRIVQVGAWYRDISAIYRLSLGANPLNYTKTALVGKKMDGYYENKTHLTSSVELVTTLGNDEYDRLLSENIVFIKLVDASAVNTVIEAIVRNTPLLVNRIEPVVEYLGKDYPFYYDDLDEACRKASSMDTIIHTYRYLKTMDKTAFTAGRFLDELSRIIRNL